ncbi:MAG: TetR/AcrR family transcriptional regulator [Elsteraceae bacterium]
MKDTRQKILDASLQLLGQTGLAGAGLNDLIALSGAPRGSLYHHFPAGKEQWVAEALRIYADKFLAEGKEALASAPSVGRAVGAILRRAASRLEKREFDAGCPVAAVILDLDAEKEALRLLCLQIVEEWRALLVAHLADRPDAPALADMIIAGFEGAMMLARMERSARPLLSTAGYLEALIDRRPTAS